MQSTQFISSANNPSFGRLHDNLSKESPMYFHVTLKAGVRKMLTLPGFSENEL